MKRKISLFKKIEIFREFRKTIRSIKDELNLNFAARVDAAYRIYTIINIPQDLLGEPYNLRKTDIDKISEKFIREYSSELSNFLNSKGLNEMYEFYEVTKVEKYSYLLVIGFSLFKSNVYFDFIRWRLIPGLLILIVTLITLILSFT